MLFAMRSARVRAVSQQQLDDLAVDPVDPLWCCACAPCCIRRRSTPHAKLSSGGDVRSSSDEEVQCSNASKKKTNNNSKNKNKKGVVEWSRGDDNHSAAPSSHPQSRGQRGDRRVRGGVSRSSAVRIAGGGRRTASSDSAPSVGSPVVEMSRV